MSIVNHKPFKYKILVSAYSDHLPKAPAFYSVGKFAITLRIVCGIDLGDNRVFITRNHPRKTGPTDSKSRTLVLLL